VANNRYCTKCGGIHDNRLRPDAIHGSVISLLRQFWSNPQNIVEPMLRHCIWRKEEEQSGIRIGSLTEYLPNYTQKRPAIIAKSGKMQKKKVAIADRIHQYAALQGLSPADIKIQFWIGEQTLFCLGENARQTDLLAGQTREYLESLESVIQEAFCCRSWEVTGQDELGILKEANDTFCIPLVIQFEYEVVWSTYVDGPPIRKIKLSLNPQT